MIPIILETDRLLLKLLNKDSAAIVLSFYEDNKTLFEPWEPVRSQNFYTLPYQKASLSAEHNQMAEGKLLRFWLFLKENPEELIGSVCFQNLLREPYYSCTLGYKLSHRFLHQGYAREGVSKAIDFMFEEINMHRIEAYIMPGNTPSHRLINRLGFEYEGTALSYARIGGAWSDHMQYALINPKDSSPTGPTPNH